MNTTPTSGAADLPEALRSTQRFEVVDCIDDKHVPAVIPNPHGPWVRYEDHIAALAAGQATAAPAEPDPTPGDHPQPCDSELFESGVSVGLFDIPKWTAEALCKGIAAATGARVDWHYIGGRVHVKALPAPTSAEGAAYAALPAPNYPKSGGFPGTFAEAQMRAFADATCALRASHGQAPAGATELAEADRRAGEAERLLATCKEDVMRFEQVRSRMKYQWGADQRVSFDEVWDEALALKKAAQAAPQAADSVTAPAPPPECETEAEKRAFAFGWFKALESERMKADNKKKDPL